eukprot:scpid90489/ scgid19817/ 
MLCPASKLTAMQLIKSVPFLFPHVVQKSPQWIALDSCTPVLGKRLCVLYWEKLAIPKERSLYSTTFPPKAMSTEVSFVAAPYYSGMFIWVGDFPLQSHTMYLYDSPICLTAPPHAHTQEYITKIVQLDTPQPMTEFLWHQLFAAILLTGTIMRSQQAVDSVVAREQSREKNVYFTATADEAERWMCPITVSTRQERESIHTNLDHTSATKGRNEKSAVGEPIQARDRSCTLLVMYSW